MKVRIIPIILAAILVAAHFLRSYNILPMMICLLAPFLLLVKKRWSIVALQLLTIPAAFIWLMILYGIIQERILEGRSSISSVLILGTVILFTLWAAWLLNSPKVKEHYPA